MFIDGPSSSDAGINQVKVTDKGKMEVYATTIDDSLSASVEGNSFIVMTDVIELTSDDESAVFYFKNEIEDGLISTGASLTIGLSDAGVNKPFYIGFPKNITGGTVLSGSDARQFNIDISSGNELNIISKQGQEGSTITTGNDVFKSYILSSGAVIPFSNYTSLRKGSSFGITIEPPVGNTSMKVQAIIFFIKRGV